TPSGHFCVGLLPASPVAQRRTDSAGHRLHRDEGVVLGAPGGILDAMRSLPGQKSRGGGGQAIDPKYLGVRAPRDRIVAAVAELVAEGGYQELTLERIAKLARVSHSTFQRLFEGKEDAFLAAQEETVRRAELALADSLGSESSPWPERVRLGLTALLQAASA